MREILFRGKRVDNGEWVYGNFVMDARELLEREQKAPITILEDGFIRRYNFSARKVEMIEIDRETVGQYTGLNDKNGQKIFEGDVVRWDAREWGNDYCEVVRWDYCLLSLRERDWAEFCEVIGTIHDHPELL